MPILKKSFPFCYFVSHFIFIWLLSPSHLFAIQPTPLAPNKSINYQQYTDTLRALIVFTRFKDDTYPGDPNVFDRDWPLSLKKDELPPFATTLLAPDITPPFPDSSLTDYFFQQSIGKFILYGEAYDSVLVTLYEESHYHKPSGSYGKLTKELLDRIDSYGFDFSKYDHNRDGLLDYVFIVVRGDSKRDKKHFIWTGASCLDGRCTGSLVAGKAEPPLKYDGITVDWNSSGSYIMHRTPGNVSPLHYYVRLMAHEIGHDLWGKHFVHIRQNRGNDVPLTHNRAKNRDCVGYVLMAGAGGAWDCGGSETISAYERDLLGWIRCTDLTSTRKHINLGDLYTTSSCFKINLSEKSKLLYITNLQRAGYFDQERHVGKNGKFQIGLRTTGLLVHLVHSNRVDVIPADNDLALGTRNAAYEGDLWGPESMTQITPWTRPNSNGFTKYPDSFQPEWRAIDYIRNSTESPHSLIFDYYSDFRTQPTIREDSWMGNETQGAIFEGPFVIQNKSTLYLNTDIKVNGATTIGTSSKLYIGPQGILRIPPGSVLELKHDAQIRIEGAVHLEGFLVKSPGAEIIVLEGGKIVSSLPGQTHQ